MHEPDHALIFFDFVCQKLIPIYIKMMNAIICIY